MSLVAKNIPPIGSNIDVDIQLKAYIEKHLKEHDPNLTSGSDPGHLHTFGMPLTIHAPVHESGGADPIGHDDLTGFVGSEHINHSGISVTGGGILSGGGALTSSQTITLANSGIDHDQTTNFLANEHIDWTNTSENFLTTDTLGAGTITGTSLITSSNIGIPSQPSLLQLTPTSLILNCDVHTDHVHITDGYPYNLILKAETSEFVQDWSLTLDVDGGNRTLAILGESVTLNDWFNQSVKVSASPTFAGLTFDFSTQDYKFTNRADRWLVLQSQTSNESPLFDIFTKDGDAVGNETPAITLWGIGLPTDVTTDAEALSIVWTNTGSYIATYAAGAGTVQPLSLYTGANTTQLVLATDNDISMSGSLGVTGEVSGGTAVFGATIVDSLTLDMTQDFKFLDAAGRLEIQSQTSNQTNEIFLLTKDGDGTDDLLLGFFATGAPSDYDPGEWLKIGFNAANNWYHIVSGSQTTGAAVTTWPIHIYTNSNTTQFVLSTDNNVAMSGALGVIGAVTGGSFLTTGNITLDSDSNKLLIGDGQDLELYHDGSNTYIDNVGVGGLLIRNMVAGGGMEYATGVGGNDQQGGDWHFTLAIAGDLTAGGTGKRGGAADITGGTGGKSEIAAGTNIGGVGGDTIFSGGAGGIATNGASNVNGEGGVFTGRGGIGSNSAVIGLDGGDGGDGRLLGGDGGAGPPIIGGDGGVGGDAIVTGGAGGTSGGGNQGDGGNVIISGGAGNTNGYILLDSNVDINGGIQLNLVTKTGAYTATASDYTILCNAVGGAFTITLPAAASHTGRIYNIKKIDSSANAVTVDGNGGETIDGGVTAILTVQYESITIQSDGSNWHIL